MPLDTQSYKGPTTGRSQQPQGEQQNPLADYFANRPAEEVIGELKQRTSNHWSMLNARGVPTLWRLIYAQAFGMDPDSGRNSTQRLEFCGPQASAVRFRINLTRAHIRQRNSLAAGSRVSYRAVAANNDASVLAQVPVAAKAISYVFREARGEKALADGLDGDGYFGEGFIWCRWDEDAGEMVNQTIQEPAVDPQTQQPIVAPDGQQLLIPRQIQRRTGSPMFKACFPWEVTRDSNIDKPSWIEVTEKASKYELIARYPEKAILLKGMTLQRDNEPGAVEMFFWDRTSMTDDTVLVRHFYHRASAAIPGGRYIGYAGDVVLWDVACPLTEGLPIVSICSARYFGTQIGYPESSDLLSQQEMIDELLSQWASNVLKFGNQSLWAEDGVEFDAQKFAEGGGFFTLKPGQQEPKVIGWNPVPEGTKYLLEKLPEFMAEISGMNSVVRGNPESNIDSGVFASLMQDIAEKFVAPTQQAYDQAVNDVGNITLALIRANADAGFLANVAGSDNSSYMQSFSEQDVSGVHKVYVERQSPAVNNLAGRFEVLEKTFQLPPEVKRGAIALLMTGDTTEYTKYDDSCTILIERENETLTKGGRSGVARSDNHMLHALSHKASLDRLRSQPPPQEQQSFQMWQMAIGAHEAHMDEHLMVWMNTDPLYLNILGLPPPPMMGMPGSEVQPPPGAQPLPPKAQLDAQRGGGGGGQSSRPQLPGKPTNGADKPSGSPSQTPSKPPQGNPA